MTQPAAKDKPENRPDLQRKGVEPSGYDGQNPATAGPGATKVDSPTPETRQGEINPSAPNDANTSGGTTPAHSQR